MGSCLSTNSTNAKRRSVVSRDSTATVPQTNVNLPAFTDVVSINIKNLQAPKRGSDGCLVSTESSSQFVMVREFPNSTHTKKSTHLKTIKGMELKKAQVYNLQCGGIQYLVPQLTDIRESSLIQKREHIEDLDNFRRASSDFN